MDSKWIGSSSRGNRSLYGGSFRGRKLVCNTRKASHDHAEGSTSGSSAQGGQDLILEDLILDDCEEEETRSEASLHEYISQTSENLDSELAAMDNEANMEVKSLLKDGFLGSLLSRDDHQIVKKRKIIEQRLDVVDVPSGLLEANAKIALQEKLIKDLEAVVQNTTDSALSELRRKPCPQVLASLMPSSSTNLPSTSLMVASTPPTVQVVSHQPQLPRALPFIGPPCRVLSDQPPPPSHPLPVLLTIGNWKQRNAAHNHTRRRLKSSDVSSIEYIQTYNSKLRSLVDKFK
jgi:hypothetical protein